MEQQKQGQNDADALPPSGIDGTQHAGAMPPFGHDLLSQPNPEAVAAIMAGQPFLPDPSLAGMPVGGANDFLLPAMMANGSAPVPLQARNKAVSADDVALYDRQIRLWGMAAQARIQNASALIITMRALANEVAKNLALAGIGSLTLLDGAAVTEADLGAQFLLASEGVVVGANRAEAASAAIRRLNPRVEVRVDAEGVTAKGPSYFAGFDVVIATDLDPDTFNIINTATRINGKAFYAAGTHGLYGFIFSDLIEHEFVIEREAGNVATAPGPETRTRTVVAVERRRDGPRTLEAVTKRELYSTWFLASDLAALPDDQARSRRRLRSVSPALSCLRALWDFRQRRAGALPASRDDVAAFTHAATLKHKALGLPPDTLRPELLRRFLQGLATELAPVAAILGGQLAQDVINVLGRAQQPIQNMVVLDADRMEAAVYPLHPEGSLGASLLSLGAAATDAAVPPGP